MFTMNKEEEVKPKYYEILQLFENAEVEIDKENKFLYLKLTVDTKSGSIMDYFEIFMGRMLLCRKASETLGLTFKLIINKQQLL